MRFSSSHAWAKLDGEIATIGISNYGKIHLGEIVNIELPEVEKVVKKDQDVCVLESNKAAVDFHSPLSGKIIEINVKLIDHLNIINTSAEDDGWIYKLKVSEKKEYDNLMTFEDYERSLK
ncbi:MAG: glycine cleavage system protein GcvH [Parachlamydiales bacterium]|jgi:glycine cleavage system H protein